MQINIFPPKKLEVEQLFFCKGLTNFNAFFVPHQRVINEVEWQEYQLYCSLRKTLRVSVCVCVFSPLTHPPFSLLLSLLREKLIL